MIILADGRKWFSRCHSEHVPNVVLSHPLLLDLILGSDKQGLRQFQYGDELFPSNQNAQENGIPT
jgi:hypothetical protein